MEKKKIYYNPELVFTEKFNGFLLNSGEIRDKFETSEDFFDL